jgi:uncharacterized YigZ family protein
MYQLSAVAQAEIEIKKSRFLCELHPVQDKAQARVILSNIRQQHPNAVHVCWALLCAGDSGLDDDGEPAGTAARPIYNILVHKQLSNVLAVVIRYWGGSKLGAGGLSRAYGQAASEACKVASMIQLENYEELACILQFADESSLRRLCEQYQVTILSVHYEQEIHMCLRLRTKLLPEFKQVAHDLLRGHLRWVQNKSI